MNSWLALPIVLPPTVIGFYLLVAFSPNHTPGSWWRELAGAPLPAGTTIDGRSFAPQARGQKGQPPASGHRP